MRRWERRWIVGGLVAGLALASGGMRAEVAAEASGGATRVIVLGIIEDPDPIPQVLWSPVRDVDPSVILNPGGADRGDGRPHVAYQVDTDWPVVVWAYAAGSDHDVALSKWNGTGWDGPTFLTATTADDLDPRVFVEPGGTVHVVWWVDGASKRIYRTQRAAGSSTWTAEEQVNAGGTAGRRPSVAVLAGTIYVAYERDAAAGGQEVVVARRQASGSYLTQVVATTTRTQPLDAMLHVEAGRLWLDWKQAADQFAYSRFDAGAWSPATTLGWSDPSWVGEEQARAEVRGIVLGP